MRSRSRAGSSGATAPMVDDAAVWHDVECAAYVADLPLWRELAAGAAGPVLELGAGTGRVALDLAARGHEVAALDSDPSLVRELDRRARERGLRLAAHAADARAFELGRRFALAIAPMQVVQLLGGPGGRRAMLAAVRRHLARGARLAIALADPLEGLPVAGALPPLPDVLERDGWVYSSRPVALRDTGAGTAIDRVREAVSPTGELRSSAVTLSLDHADAAGLTGLAAEAGFAELPGRAVPATEGYVGSDVVLLEAV